MTWPHPSTHPADLPCEDPDCNENQGHILCQRCTARVERARTGYQQRRNQRHPRSGAADANLAAAKSALARTNRTPPP